MRGPTMYVALNPKHGTARQRLSPRPSNKSPPRLTSSNGHRLVPFNHVENEAYDTYFDIVLHQEPMTERIHARYWIETAFPLDSAAATMAGEQSTGTFLRVPGETDELRERFAARVESITN